VLPNRQLSVDGVCVCARARVCERISVRTAFRPIVFRVLSTCIQKHRRLSKFHALDGGIACHEVAHLDGCRVGLADLISVRVAAPILLRSRDSLQPEAEKVMLDIKQEDAVVMLTNVFRHRDNV
jgi:hypothetical protein